MWWNSSWAISNPIRWWCESASLNMPANLENSAVATGLEKDSFPSQRKAIPKNAQTTAQLHSSHTLIKWCLKFSKPGFNRRWTVNFQMFKLFLEKAEGPGARDCPQMWELWDRFCHSPQKKPTLLTPCSQTCRLLNCEEINLCCLSYLVIVQSFRHTEYSVQSA